MFYKATKLNTYFHMFNMNKILASFFLLNQHSLKSFCL